jgi:hypothetical protein
MQLPACMPLGHPSPQRLALVRRHELSSRTAEPGDAVSAPTIDWNQKNKTPQNKPYGWELIESRLTALSAPPGCANWDCWPIPEQIDHRSALACWNFIQARSIPQEYTHVALLLPAEALAALPKKIAPDQPLKPSRPHMPDGVLYVPNSSDLRKGIFLEAASPEAMFLHHIPQEQIWPLGSRLSDTTAYSWARSPGLNSFPPADAFVLWLDAWAASDQSDAETMNSSRTDLRNVAAAVSEESLAPLLHKNVLFVTSLPLFRHCLRQAHELQAAPVDGAAGPHECAYSDPSMVVQAPGEEPLPPIASLRAVRLRRPSSSRQNGTMFRPSDPSQSELSAFPPALLSRFLSRTLAAPATDPDSLLAQTLEDLTRSCCSQYAEWTKLNVHPMQLSTFFRYLRKWLATHSGHHAEGEIKTRLPRAFDLLVAARACVDGNFSFELARLLQTPEHTSGLWALPEITVLLSDLYPETLSLRLESFATFEHFRQSLKPPRLRGVSGHRSRTTGDRNTDGASEQDFADPSWVTDESRRHCSFPDEDIFLDSTVAAIQNDVKSRIRERITHVHELSTSLEDGLDVRETIRNWHRDQIMVRSETLATSNKLGSVVIIFADSETHRASADQQKTYPWKTLWHAEQHDATHLMFFATDFRTQIIGPGIAASEFGGFAAVPADRWVVDLWDHPYLKSIAQSDAEHLLLAAGFAGPEGLVVHIGPKSPREDIRALLRRNRRPLIHVPIAEIERNKIRKLKTFHILADASVRNYAHRYIRKDQL